MEKSKRGIKEKSNREIKEKSKREVKEKRRRGEKERSRHESEIDIQLERSKRLSGDIILAEVHLLYLSYFS